jgi:putative ABC transport system ATP-binding protein
MVPAASGDASPAGVELSHISRRFCFGSRRTLTAVDDVSLTITSGELVALMGPSGSGKSTLLHVIAGIEQVDSGRVSVGGVDVTSLGRRQLAVYRRQIGFVFQRFNLLPALTVLDNVVVPVLPFRTRFDKRQRATAILDAVGLHGRESSLPSQLSGGEQQRVAIARALMGSPRLLLADEPTGNLDSVTGTQILDLLFDIRRQHGVTMLFATHDESIAERCDRVLRLRDGQLVSDVLVEGFESTPAGGYPGRYGEGGTAFS